MRISDWSSDVCSSDLLAKVGVFGQDQAGAYLGDAAGPAGDDIDVIHGRYQGGGALLAQVAHQRPQGLARTGRSQVDDAYAGGHIGQVDTGLAGRSEEHTSELQSLMRISYAVFCLKKTKQTNATHRTR